MASLLDGVRASGNRDVCVKMAPTQRGQRWGLLSMPVDEEVESLHIKFLAAPPSECMRHVQEDCEVPPMGGKKVFVTKSTF